VYKNLKDEELGEIISQEEFFKIKAGDIVWARFDSELRKGRVTATGWGEDMKENAEKLNHEMDFDEWACNVVAYGTMYFTTDKDSRIEDKQGVVKVLTIEEHPQYFI
jgi:hypothetical protein